MVNSNVRHYAMNKSAVLFSQPAQLANDSFFTDTVHVALVKVLGIACCLKLTLFLILILTTICRCQNFISIEFSLNVFIEFIQFSDKNICHYIKRVQTCNLLYMY